MFSKSFLFVFLFIFSFQFATAQKGKVVGKVISAKTGEALIGATISVMPDNKKTQSDLNGNYSLTVTSDKELIITCTYVSFSSKSISNIIVKNGDVITQDIVMDKAADLAAVVVQGTSGRKKETVNSILIAQKNSSNVSDGISAEVIKRTPDRNTSDILRRVSGASVQDDKFVVVRGLNDRYNAAFLNGSPLLSTEADRKAFSFDIFPANMLDNLVIYKTATPDMPAEFAGGAIFINTKDVVTKNFQSFTFSSGFNTATTFKSMERYNGGALDFLGIDDKTRALPKFIPNTTDFPQPASSNPLTGKNWRNDWSMRSAPAFLNVNLQYINGKNFQRKGKDFLSSLFSISYNRNSTIAEGLNTEHQANGTIEDTSGRKTIFNQKFYSTTTLLGALANFSMKLNDRNTINFRNLLSMNSEDRVITREGYADISQSNPDYSKGNVLWFSSNTILSSQLSGDHYIRKIKLKFNWAVDYASMNRSIPDLRTFISVKREGLDTAFKASISDNATSNGNGGGIYYASLHENSKDFKFDVQRSFNFSKSITSNFKLGTFLQARDRDYEQRNLGMVRGNVGTTYFENELLSLPQNKIFTRDNIRPGGFILAEDKNPFNNYTASTSLTAGYLMADQRFWNVLRLIYGYRLEYFDLKLNLPKGGNEFDLIRKINTDYLPSANIIYSLNSKQNLRFSYSKTLNRPEFREIAPAKFFDFATRYTTNGDTALNRAVIDNYDFRYEIYPGRGQVLSISAFYKKFTDPIETATAPDKEKEAAYFNVLGATNKGIEVDLRTLVGSLFSNIPQKSILNDLTFFTNFALIKSNVTAKKATDTSALNLNRPLQGQSPYCINLGLTYQNNDNGFSSTLVANRVGQRIFIVGNINEANIWENGRTVLDFQLAKTIEKRNLEIKLNVKDLLAQKTIFFEDVNADNKYKVGQDYVRWYRTFGRVISLSITYKF